MVSSKYAAGRRPGGGMSGAYLRRQKRDINNVMRGFDPASTKSIGGKSTYLYDAAGNNTKLKL